VESRQVIDRAVETLPELGDVACFRCASDNSARREGAKPSARPSCAEPHSVAASGTYAASPRPSNVPGVVRSRRLTARRCTRIWARAPSGQRFAERVHWLVYPLRRSGVRSCSSLVVVHNRGSTPSLSKQWEIHAHRFPAMTSTGALHSRNIHVYQGMTLQDPLQR
jgi:hypothetical protein